ncbi:MAG: hypothetical protein UU47_C0008G0006 [candidate division TM6 bacterium GW2011_GWE2_41_16]|nr:MAG: hypothetical protein UU47_C0008G0006 [candidate division TM6 bacterium GW2011_GWE2_41_16]
MNNQITTELDQLLNDLFTQTEKKLSSQDLSLIEKHKNELCQRLLPIVQHHLDRCSAEIYLELNDPNDFYWSIILLARLKEPLLFPLMHKLCLLPREFIDNGLGGDFVTEELPKALALTCNGQWKILQSIIENDRLDVYIRSACLDACRTMVALNTIAREEFVAYLKKLLLNGLECTDSTEEWNAFVIITCCDIWPGECIKEIRELFGARLVDTEIISIDNVLDDLQKKQQDCIDDIKEKIDRFFAFHVQKEPSKAQLDDNENFKNFDEFIQEQDQRKKMILSFLSEKKIGRNEPCSCLSGKKYKHCCIHKVNIPDDNVAIETSTITFDPLPSSELSNEELDSLDELYSMIQNNTVHTEQVIKNFLVTHPNIPSVYNYLFVIQTQSKKYREAINTLKITVEKFPTYLFGLIEYGFYFLRQGDPERAHQILKGARTLNQLYPERQTFHASEFKAFYYFMGTYCVAIHDFKQMKTYTSILRKLPGGSKGAMDIVETARRKLLNMDSGEFQSIIASASATDLCPAGMQNNIQS